MDTNATQHDAVPADALASLMVVESYDHWDGLADGLVRASGVCRVDLAA